MYTVYSVISLPKILYIHRIYMVLANPRNKPRRVLPKMCRCWDCVTSCAKAGAASSQREQSLNDSSRRVVLLPMPVDVAFTCECLLVCGAVVKGNE